MLASAAQTYALRYGVRAGRRAVVFTNNDSAYRAIEPLRDAGTHVAAVVDVREGGPGDEAAVLVKREGIELAAGSAVTRVLGAAVEAAEVRTLSPDGASVGSGPRRPRMRSRLRLRRLESDRPPVFPSRRASCASTRRGRRSSPVRMRHAGASRAGSVNARPAPPAGSNTCPNVSPTASRPAPMPRARRGTIPARRPAVRPSRNGAPPLRSAHSGRCRSRPGGAASVSWTSRTT